MKVTVVIPTFRRPRLLRRAVESVFAAETGAVSCGVVVVDNASPEPVAEVVRDFEDRVQYLRNEENLGVTGNWNRCRQVAQESGGDYWMLLEDDNYLEPSFFSAVSDALSRNPWVRFVYSACTEFDDQGRESIWRPWAVGGGFLRSGLVPRRQLLAFAFTCPIRISSLIWRKSEAMRGLPSFLDDHYWCQDVSGLCEAALCAGKGVYIEKPIMRYYMNPRGVSAESRATKRIARAELMRALRFNTMLLAAQGGFSLEEWAIAARSAPVDRLMLAELALFSPIDSATASVRRVLGEELTRRSGELRGVRKALAILGPTAWQAMERTGRRWASWRREPMAGSARSVKAQ